MKTPTGPKWYSGTISSFILTTGSSYDSSSLFLLNGFQYTDGYLTDLEVIRQARKRRIQYNISAIHPTNNFLFGPSIVSVFI